MKEFCLAISGSDSSCGAGSQLDLQVLRKTGVNPLIVISAITSQTADFVLDVWPLSQDIFRSQLETLLTHYQPKICKIGMITEVGIEVILQKILENSFCSRIILDPILESSSGFRFIDLEVISKLFEKCFLITPNVPEMEKILDISIKSVSDMEKSLLTFHERYSTPNILIKGGHLKECESLDILFIEGRIVHFETQPLDLKNGIHGTGCFLSSAIAGYLCNDLPLEESISKAKKLLEISMINAVRLKDDKKSVFNL